MGIRLGNAPCSWGVEFADDPRNPPWDKVLDECAAAGFSGIELGPVGFFPDDPAELGSALEARGLILAGGVVFQPFHDGQKWDAVRATLIRTCQGLAAHGAAQVILIDSISRVRSPFIGRSHDAPRMSQSDHLAFLDRIREAIGIAEGFGLTTSIHPHAGGYCDFQDECDWFMDEFPADRLQLCIDTAHMTLAGMDPLAMTRAYAGRISHVHLKDLDPGKKAALVRDGQDFYDACADDLFCRLGEGEVNFTAFRELLGTIGYDGWCIVEQDCAPDATISKMDLAKANRLYLGSVGFESSPADHDWKNIP